MLKTIAVNYRGKLPKPEIKSVLLRLKTSVERLVYFLIDIT